MKTLSLFILLVVVFGSSPTRAEPMDSRFTHIYWGLGSNFSPLGNLRVGIGPVEVGIVQGTGVGAVYVHRTPGPLFLQLGVLSTSGGGGIIGGGGLEWKASSFSDSEPT